MDSGPGNAQGRKKRRVGRELGSVSTNPSRTRRNVYQKEDKDIADGKHSGSKEEQNKLKDEQSKLEEGQTQGEKYVCPVCLESANAGVVECGKCLKWYHFACVGLEHMKDDLDGVEWACEACRRMENMSDDDVFVDSVGAPARGEEPSEGMTQDGVITIPKPIVATTSHLTRHVDIENRCTGPGNEWAKEHAPIASHEGTSVFDSTTICNMHDNMGQPLVEQSTREHEGSQEQRTGMSESNNKIHETTHNLPADGMLVFSTCEDLEAQLEAREVGSLVDSNSTAPKPQNHSREVTTPACGDAGYSESEGVHQITYNMQIPCDTVSVFLDLAEQNTRDNIETLGILAGVVADQNIHVTHLVIPKQKGDSTTCECLEEELVVATLQENEVVQVGWIHTHPSHGTFLSSIDVHTQYRLQCDIPGAVAIVHSHRDGQTGHFQLTKKGMQELANCQEDGFHEGCARTENWETVQIQAAKDATSIQAIDLRKEQSTREQTRKMEESIQKQSKKKPDSQQELKGAEVVP